MSILKLTNRASGSLMFTQREFLATGLLKQREQIDGFLITPEPTVVKPHRRRKHSGMTKGTVDLGGVKNHKQDCGMVRRHYRYIAGTKAAAKPAYLLQKLVLRTNGWGYHETETQGDCKAQRTALALLQVVDVQ